MRNIVIGGNWKLKVTSLQEAKKIIQEINNKYKQNPNIECFIAVPAPYLGLLTKFQDTIGIVKLCSQNVYFKQQGPYTGEISIDMLNEFNISYSLVGHSERRILFGETDENINKKIKLLLDHKKIPILCIGETYLERNLKQTEKILSNQLEKALFAINNSQIPNIIIAYEPVWAINNPELNPEVQIKAATAEEAEQTHLFIRNWLKKNYDKNISETVRIIYGGSMNEKNAKTLIGNKNIDGGLIGTSSTSSISFIEIIRQAFDFFNALH